MITPKTSTSNDNAKSIALLSPNLLTLRANALMNESLNTAFGRWLKPLIEKLKESQADVARDAGITPVQLSRIVTGTSGVKRENAINIIDTINKFAGYEIANKTEGLNLAGFSSNESQKLPEPIEFSDFDGLEMIDLIALKKYAQYLRVLKKLEKSQAPNLDEFDNSEGFYEVTDDDVIAEFPIEIHQEKVKKTNSG